MVALSAASLYFCYRYPKQDFSGALAYVRQHAAPDATVAGLGPAAAAYRLYYAPDITPIYTEADYAAALKPGQAVELRPVDRSSAEPVKGTIRVIGQRVRGRAFLGDHHQPPAPGVLLRFALEPDRLELRVAHGAKTTAPVTERVR